MSNYAPAALRNFKCPFLEQISSTFDSSRLHFMIHGTHTHTPLHTLLHRSARTLAETDRTAHTTDIAVAGPSCIVYKFFYSTALRETW